MKLKKVEELSERELSMLCIAKETGLDYMMGLWNEVSKQINKNIENPTTLEVLTTQFNASAISSAHLVVQILGMVTETNLDTVMNLYVSAFQNNIKQQLDDLQKSMN